MAALNITTGTSFSPWTTTALLSLANGAYFLGTTGFDNSAGLMTMLDLQLVFSAAVTPLAGGSISVFLIPALDGTNYASPPGASSVAPPGSLVAGTYAAVNASTTVIQIQNMPMLSKCLHKVLILNSLGVSFSSTGTITSTAYPKTLAMV